MSRAEFSNPTKRAANKRAAGRCECHRISWMEPCGQPLGPGNRFYEHINVDFTTKDNSLDNCAVLTKTCWKIKTAKYDLPHIAKTKRMEDRDLGIKRGSGRGFWKPEGSHFDWRRGGYVKERT